MTGFVEVETVNLSGQRAVLRFFALNDDTTADDDLIDTLRARFDRGELQAMTVHRDGGEPVEVTSRGADVYLDAIDAIEAIVGESTGVG